VTAVEIHPPHIPLWALNSLGPNLAGCDVPAQRVDADAQQRGGLLEAVASYGSLVGAYRSILHGRLPGYAVAGARRHDRAGPEWADVPPARTFPTVGRIDENLVRNRLSDLERAELVAARKGWYEAKHPEARNPNVRGGPGRGKKTAEKKSAASFAVETAAKTGVNERTVRRDVEIAESIPEDVRDALRRSFAALRMTTPRTRARGGRQSRWHHQEGGYQHP